MWNEDLNPTSNIEDLNEPLNISNMDGQMMPKWTQMNSNDLNWIPWAILIDKLNENVEYHEQYGWTNDAKMNSNEDLNPMSNMDGQMMPKWTQMKTWIPWAILMDKWCQNELKWRLESHEQYGWTNDAKMNSNENLNIMSNMDGQMMPKWTQMKTRIPMSNMDGQMMPKWTQMKTWIPWAIWMDKWCQNELKGRLEYHEQFGWSNDAKMNSNEDLNPMSNIDGQMMPKWTQMKSWISMSNMDGQMMPKWTQMKTWIPWAIWMDKWCQNELKWRLESHEQYGWTNDAKMNSNELNLNLMSNMDGQIMPKWTQMKSRIPWAIWMDKWCHNEHKWRLASPEQYWRTNDAKMNSNEESNTMSNMDGQMMPKWTQMKTWIPWAIWMDKWCQNELKWRLESHEQYGWTNDAKMNSNEESNPMSNIENAQMMPKWTQMNSNEDLNLMTNMDGQMMPKWTSNEDLNLMSIMDGKMMPKLSEMRTWIPWAILMDKWCQNELKWKLEYHEQYGWTNDAKMNSNEDLNTLSNMDGQIMPKWTQMKTWIPWAIWMDKWCQNEHKWRLESHEQYGWTNDAKMNSNEDLNPMSNMDGQMMPKWTQMKTWIPWAIWMDKWCQNELKWRLESHEQYGWTNDAKMNSNEDSNIMSNMDGQMMPKWTQMKTWIPWAIWMDKWCQNELKWRLESHEQYGWTNDAKMNSNEESNPMSNMDGQMMPKWTQMKTWIPWAIWMDKWCQNELKWRLEYHEQYGWTNDAKMNSNEDLNPMSNIDGQMMPKWTQMKSRIPWAIWMDKWCQNELKWRLESHEQYGWTNDAKMNSNEDLNLMSNMDGQMMPKWMSNLDGQMLPKWTQMKTWIPWAIWMDKWCQNEHKWRLESHEQYWWTNDAKMNWTQMKTWIPWAIWMDKWCQNELKWRLEYHEQYGWTNDAKMNSNEDLNPMSNMDGQMMSKWTQMKTWIPWAIWMDKWCQNELKWRVESHEQYGWTNDAKMNSNEDLNPMSNMDGQMMPK